jgi:hypothetical protein
VSSAIRGAELRSQISSYTVDASDLTRAALATAAKTASFTDIYHASLSADAVMAGLNMTKFRPRLAGARIIILRVPLLVALGQSSVALVELRRFVELVCWTVYFTDHPIEWRSFEGVVSGFAQDQRMPISYAAHRELSFYIDYARELMADEPSKLGIAAVNGIKQASYELNSSVHASEAARITARKPPLDEISEAALRTFGRLQRRVFANCCTLLAAYGARRFNSLSGAARRHFDWLAGPKLGKLLRAGPFGLPSTRL